MEIKTEKNEIIELSDNHDPLKGTKYDTMFGSKSPLRVEGTTLNDWINGDEVLGNYLQMIDFVKYFSLLIDETGNEFNHEDLEAYFKGDRKSINEDVCVKIERLDRFERKYDIPSIAILLRRFSIPYLLEYLADGNNERFITETLGKEMIKSWHDGTSLSDYNFESIDRIDSIDDDIIVIFLCYSGCVKSLDESKYIDRFGDVCYPNEPVFCAYAALGGKLNVLKWLRDPKKGGRVCNWDKECCACAAGNGHLDILKWLRDPNTGGGVCPWDSRCCIYTAQNGHLDVLKWLRDPTTGGGVCPWDEYCCAWAARNGHLDVLKWLRDPKKGGGVCPWYEWCCTWAVECDDDHILDWLKANNCPCGGTKH